MESSTTTLLAQAGGVERSFGIGLLIASRWWGMGSSTLLGPEESGAWSHTDGGGAECVLLRKEVIQPHLPVRLPCYDFVPIASPTFDSSPHTRWLGHWLRVLPTFVT